MSAYASAVRLRRILAVAALATAVVVLGGAETDALAAASCFGSPATITGTGVIDGTSGNDVIIGSAGADTIDGRGGNDRICALDGNDFVSGGLGNDLLDGGAGN